MFTRLGQGDWCGQPGSVQLRRHGPDRRPDCRRDRPDPEGDLPGAEHARQGGEHEGKDEGQHGVTREEVIQALEEHEDEEPDIKGLS